MRVSARGLGPLSYEAQRGMYLHPTYAITPARVPLCVIDAWMWAREFKDKDGHRPGLCESTRWIEGYERVAEPALLAMGRLWTTSFSLGWQAPTKSSQLATHGSDFIVPNL